MEPVFFGPVPPPAVRLSPGICEAAGAAPTKR